MPTRVIRELNGIRYLQNTNFKKELLFWHGGNLPLIENHRQKKAKFYFGVGAYFTEDSNIVEKYCKTRRKRYLCSVKVGKDIDKVLVPYDQCRRFCIDTFSKVQIFKALNLLKTIKYSANRVRLKVFNNRMLNDGFIKESNSVEFRKFLARYCDYDYDRSKGLLILFNLKSLTSYEEVKTLPTIVSNEVYKCQILNDGG